MIHFSAWRPFHRVLSLRQGKCQPGTISPLLTLHKYSWQKPPHGMLERKIHGTTTAGAQLYQRTHSGTRQRGTIPVPATLSLQTGTLQILTRWPWGTGGMGCAGRSRGGVLLCWGEADAGGRWKVQGNVTTRCGWEINGGGRRCWYLVGSKRFQACSKENGWQEGGDGKFYSSFTSVWQKKRITKVRAWQVGVGKQLRFTAFLNSWRRERQPKLNSPFPGTGLGCDKVVNAPHLISAASGHSRQDRKSFQRWL